jgi:phage-related baseplate assembly protein
MCSDELNSSTACEPVAVVVRAGRADAAASVLVAEALVAEVEALVAEAEALVVGVEALVVVVDDNSWNWDKGGRKDP